MAEKKPAPDEFMDEDSSRRTETKRSKTERKAEKKKADVPINSRLYLLHAPEWNANPELQQQVSLQEFLRIAQKQHGSSDTKLSYDQLKQAIAYMEKSGTVLDEEFKEKVLNAAKGEVAKKEADLQSPSTLQTAAAAAGVGGHMEAQTLGKSKVEISNVGKNENDLPNKPVLPKNQESVLEKDISKQIPQPAKPAPETPLQPVASLNSAIEKVNKLKADFQKDNPDFFPDSKVTVPEAQKANPQSPITELPQKAAVPLAERTPAKPAVYVRNRKEEDRANALVKAFSDYKNAPDSLSALPILLNKFKELGFSANDATEKLYELYGIDFKTAKRQVTGAPELLKKTAVKAQGKVKVVINTTERMLNILAQETSQDRNLDKGYEKPDEAELSRQFNIFEQEFLDIEDEWKKLTQEERATKESKEEFIKKLSLFIEKVNKEALPALHINAFASQQGGKLQEEVYDLWSKILREPTLAQLEKKEGLEKSLYHYIYEVAALLAKNPSPENFQAQVLELLHSSGEDEEKYKSIENVEPRVLLDNLKQIVEEEGIPIVQEPGNLEAATRQQVKEEVGSQEVKEEPATLGEFHTVVPESVQEELPEVVVEKDLPTTEKRPNEAVELPDDVIEMLEKNEKYQKLYTQAQARFRSDYVHEGQTVSPKRERDLKRAFDSLWELEIPDIYVYMKQKGLI